MLLIADGGSTKCQWALAGGEGVCRIFETVGFNPAISSREAIVSGWREAFDGVRVEAVYYYGAGCIGGDANKRMADALRELTGAERVSVMSDMVGAARACLADESGVVGILGTGANSCYYASGQVLKGVRPLGFILGDEGSGADIGKHIVADALKGLFPADLTEAFYTFAGIDYPDFIEQIYRGRQPNAFLARFSRFASQHIERQEIKTIVCNRFDAFVCRNLLQYDEASLASGVCFVGSVAEVFSELLSGVCASHRLAVRTVLRSPISRLVAYHCR